MLKPHWGGKVTAHRQTLAGRVSRSLRGREAPRCCQGVDPRATDAAAQANAAPVRIPRNLVPPMNRGRSLCRAGPLLCFTLVGCGGTAPRTTSTPMPAMLIEDLRLPPCSDVPRVAPPAWRRATTPQVPPIAMAQLVVELRQASGAVQRTGHVRTPPSIVPKAGGNVDSTGRVTLNLGWSTPAVEVLAIGYGRVYVPVTLRPGYSDTVLVSLRALCTEANGRSSTRRGHSEARGAASRQVLRRQAPNNTLHSTDLL